MNQVKENLVTTIVGLFIKVANATILEEKETAALTAAMAEAFVLCPTDEEYAELFGNGINGKAHIAGKIRDGLEAGIAKLAKTKQERVRNIVRVRFSEARKLRRLEGFPRKGETIQTALKRYTAAPATTKQAKPEGNAAGWAIPADASMDEIAEQLSVWVAKHGAASAGLVAKLADFLPVSVKRGTRKVV